MRITVTFFTESPFILPLSYNPIIQAFIYSHLDNILSTFIHEKGYQWEKRSFKLFTFSRILGEVIFCKDKSGFLVKSPFKLIISSPKDDILQSFAENLVRTKELNLNGKDVYLESINVHFTPPMVGEVKVRMLSPVTVYSTLKTLDGRSKTYYYNPFEREFSELIRANIIKKYQALYSIEPSAEEFIITPLRVSKKDEKIVMYKGTVIKGWMGAYRIIAEPELLKLAYDAGIGSKNSQGFGCFEILGINDISY